MSSQRLLTCGLVLGLSAWVGGLPSLNLAAGATLQERLPDLQLPPQEPVPLVIPDGGNEFGQPLLRGPVHEAFAELYQAEPVPGRIIVVRPPALIDELPPDLQPNGRNIQWISGYWAFDEQAEEFLWVSGIWREIPPGFRWLPGYWLELDNQQGYQWVSGTWLPETSNEVQYLPTAPPATLERGPVGMAPTANHIWVPGNWHWQERQYAWRPGFWSVGHVDWVWIPARYQWTPRGFLFCRGYWDYPLVRRGTLFSPYRFHRPFFAQPLVAFTPRVVIAMDVLPRHLWVRPSHCHYYFGDFYDGFAGHGFVPWHHWAVGGRPGVNININFGNPRDFYCGFDPLFHHVSRTTVFNNVNVTNIQVNQINQQFNYFNQVNQQFTSLQTQVDQRPGRDLGKVSRRGEVGGSGNSREARLGLSLDDHVQSVGRDRFAEVRDQQRRVRLEELTQTRELATARQAIERRSRGANPADRGVEIASLPANPRGRRPTADERGPRGSGDDPTVQRPSVGRDGNGRSGGARDSSTPRPGRSEGLPTVSSDPLNTRPNNEGVANDVPRTGPAGDRRPGRSEGLPATGGREASEPRIGGRDATGRDIAGREVAGRDTSGREIAGREVERGRPVGSPVTGLGQRDWIDPAAAARGRGSLNAAGDRSGIRRAGGEAAGADRQRRSAVEQAQERMAERLPGGRSADRAGAIPQSAIPQSAIPQGAAGRRIAPGTSETELRSWVENYQRRQGVDPNTARRLGERLVPPGSQRQIDLSAEERARQRDTPRAIPGNRDMGGRDIGGRNAGGRPVGGREAGGRPVGGREAGGRPVGGREAGGRETGGRETGGRGATPGLGGNPTYPPGAGQAPRNQPAVGRGLGSQPATGRSLSNQPATGRSLSNQPATGRSLSNQPAAGRSLSNQPAAGRSLSNQPATGRSLSNQPATGRSLSNQPAAGRSLSNQPATGQYSGRSSERPAAQRPSPSPRQSGGRSSGERVGGGPGNGGANRGGGGGSPSRGNRGRGGN